MDLYRFYDEADRLLYVGISVNAALRSKDHSKEKTWWPEVRRMDVEHLSVGGRAEAEAIEKAAIVAERPMHNVAHNASPVVPRRERGRRSGAPPVSAQVHPLVGTFVHVRDAGSQYDQHQGHITDDVGEGFLLVQWFSWWSGDPTDSAVVHVGDMGRWRFYKNHEDWLAEGSRLMRRTETEVA